MANDRPDPGEGEELKATVGEQLREKAHLEEEAERERRGAEERESAVERHKQAERSEVARHVGAEGWPDARRTARQAYARERPSFRVLLALGFAIALVTRLLGRRRA